MIDERQVYERLLAAGAPVTWEAERGWCRWAATECIVVGHPEDDTYEAIDLWGDRLAYVTDTDDVVRVVCAHLGLTEPVAETTTGEAAKPLDRADDVAETVADSSGFGRPLTLAKRLARAVGVDLTGGDTPIVEAVERLRADRDTLIGELNELRRERDAVHAALDDVQAAPFDPADAIRDLEKRHNDHMEAGRGRLDRRGEWPMSDGWLGTAGARIGRAVGVRLEDGDIAVAEGVERMALAMLYIRAASGLTDAATDMEVALSVDRLCRENSARGELARLRKEHDAAQTLIRDVHEALDAFGWRRDALVSRVNRAVAMMDALRRDLRDLQEAHELALAELSRPLAEREAELRAAFGADDVDAVLSDRDDAIRRADAAEARLRLVGDAVAALVEVARG